MDAADLVIGEMYALNGRRARLDSLGWSQGGDTRFRPFSDEPVYAQAVFSLGRSFDRQVTLTANRYRPSYLSKIEETWQGRKARLASERALKQEAEAVSRELRSVLRDFDMGGGWTDGSSFSVYADLAQTRVVIAALEAYRDQLSDISSSPELAELLG